MRVLLIDQPVKRLGQGDLRNQGFLVANHDCLCLTPEMRLPSVVEGMNHGNEARFHQGVRRQFQVKRAYQKRQHPGLTIYYPLYLHAMERSQTIAEGAFASLDRMRWSRFRMRGPWKCATCQPISASQVRVAASTVGSLKEVTSLS